MQQYKYICNKCSRVYKSEIPDEVKICTFAQWNKDHWEYCHGIYKIQYSEIAPLADTMNMELMLN